VALGVGAAKRETGAGRGSSATMVWTDWTPFDVLGGACGRGMVGGGEWGKVVDTSCNENISGSTS